METRLIRKSDYPPSCPGGDGKVSAHNKVRTVRLGSVTRGLVMMSCANEQCDLLGRKVRVEIAPLTRNRVLG